MSLIVFLRGVNVGGHRTFRPSILARELSHYDVVNVGAAGTFVVRKPGSRAKFRAELRQKLPFEAEVVLCDARDLIRIEIESPFGTEPARPDIVRFEEPIRLRSVPSSYENDQLSWPDRQTVRCAGDDTELEHNNGDRADFEKPGEEKPLITRQQDASRASTYTRYQRD
jgi:hypothetical protein